MLGVPRVEIVRTLDWSTGHAGNRYQLQQFICADPVRVQWERYRGEHHPRPWELEVQSHIRGLRPPTPSGEAVRLGFDQGELVAATHFGFESDGEDFLIWALAVSRARRGEGLGREALEDVLQGLMNTKAELGLTSEAFARIWDDNEPSQAVFRSAGFEPVGATAKPGLTLWGHRL